MTSRYTDISFKRWGAKHPSGMQQYKVFYKDQFIAQACRTGKKAGSWWVIANGWSKAVKGFRSKYAVIEFLQEYYLDDPWRDDPTTQGYPEYSVDRKTWTRTRPEGDVYMRYVGITVNILIKAKTDE